MDEDTIEMIAQEADRLLVAPRLLLLLQNIAHRGVEPWLRVRFGNGVEQRQKLETHLPAPEGKCLDDDDIGCRLPECLQQKIAAAGQKLFADGVAGLIGEAGKTGTAGDHGRQCHGGHISTGKSVDRYAAGDDRDFAPILRQRTGNAARPRQMADAEQMLNIEENAQGRGIRGRHADFRHCSSFCHCSSNNPVNCRMLA